MRNMDKDLGTYISHNDKKKQNKNKRKQKQTKNVRINQNYIATKLLFRKTWRHAYYIFAYKKSLEENIPKYQQ